MTQEYAAAERRSCPESGPEASADAIERAEPVTQAGFSAGFERCFGRVYRYVSRRVDGRDACERIVSAVLEENLDLLVERGDDSQEFGRIKVSLDRLIGLDGASRRSGHAIRAPRPA